MSGILEKAGREYAKMIFPQITEEHKVLLSFGMQDVSIAEKSSKYFREVFLDSLAKHYKMLPIEIEPLLNMEAYKKQESEFQKGVHVQLLQLRKEEGLMVC